MSTKTLVWVLAFVGSSVGSYIPVLWGGSLFSIASVLGGGVGGVIGVAVGLKVGNRING